MQGFQKKLGITEKPSSLRYEVKIPDLTTFTPNDDWPWIWTWFVLLFFLSYLIGLVWYGIL